MIPWSLLDTTLIPGGGELRLLRRGDEFSIRLGGNELMNSRLGGSEEALATLAFARLTDRATAPTSGPRILIGGLGMGFTLRAALAALGPDAAIEVAELVPAVVAWARTEMAPVFGDSMADNRLTIIAGDVGEAIRAGKARYDAILLDVDNGPDGLSRTANDALYDAVGLRAACQALRQGGVLAVWSSGPDAAFTRRLRQAGFAVDQVPVRAMGKRGGARHLIWIAVRGS
ncbi:spermidine synthase [Rhodopseudomonas rhenobacensis]|uniref:Spermidine synthase n=1 Tax=Rhodopseudomonas rhenobacensis TaxID=87461 RepID=A0A7W7Z0Q6_9BRAD|nr:spermidine synthase [Rhodopseudomonas rhenobacensis]